MADDSPASPSPEASTPTPSNRAALVTVFLVVVIDLLGFGLVLPLLPRYGDEYLTPIYPGAENSGVRGMIVGLLMSSFSFMQFLCAPLWGRLSDRIGRRPVLLIGLLGSVVFYALFGVASEVGVTGDVRLSVILLFVARIGAGIAGATLGTAQAVIADSTSPENRKRGMALIGVAFGIGFTFGPAIGAGALYFFPHTRGAVGFLASGFSLIALVIGYARMPETWKPGSTAARRTWLNWNGFQAAFATPTVGTLILIFFLSTFSFACFEPTLAYLTKDLFGYGEEKNFLVFTYVGFVLMLCQGGLYQMMARRGVQEITFMLLGTCLMALGLGALGLQAAYIRPESDMPHGLALALFLIALLVSVTGFAFVTPSVQALVSRRSDPAKQGEILGTNQSINALARILGPATGVGLYSATPGHAAPYALATGLLVLAFGLTLRARRA